MEDKLGLPIKTNIKHKVIDSTNENYWDVTDDVKNNPIVVLDNVTAKSYFPVFDDLYIDEPQYTPLVISYSWELGGGGEELQHIVSFFTDSESSLFFPTLVINSLMASVTDLLLIKTINTLISKLRKADKSRRPRVAYYIDGKLVNFEFPPYATSQDIADGLKLVHKYALKASHNDYFVLDTKNNRWFKES